MSKQVNEPIFNQVTDLLDNACYKKRVQESTEIYKYMTDMTPTPVCYMKGQAFQGSHVKQAPGSLSDIEFYMQTAPLREDLDLYCMDKNPRNVAPSMPSILQNRLLIPDCQDIMKASYNKVRRTDFNAVSDHRRNDIISEPIKPMWNVHRGIDTRQEMKDEFRKREQSKLATAMGKNVESGTLYPMPEVRCTIGSDDLKCMHVYESGVNAGPGADTSVRRFHPGKDIQYYADKQATNSVPSPTPQTITVASSMPAFKTLREFSEEQAIQEGCKTKFYNWESPCYPGTL